MISAKLEIKGTSILDSKTFVRKFEKVVQGLAAQVEKESAAIVRAEFTPPGAVVYPIQWRSRRQRAAFFASNGFGRGIPTRRSGKSDQAWEVVYASGKGASGEFTLRNKVSYTRFVRGGFRPGNTYQQPFHINTGWEQSTTVKDRVFKRLRVIIAARFRETLGSFGTLKT